jgi:hypothetical protein
MAEASKWSWIIARAVASSTPTSPYSDQPFRVARPCDDTGGPIPSARIAAFTLASLSRTALARTVALHGKRKRNLTVTAFAHRAKQQRCETHPGGDYEGRDPKADENDDLVICHEEFLRFAPEAVEALEE